MKENINYLLLPLAEPWVKVFLGSNIREGANDYSENGSSGATASSSLNVLKTLVSVIVLIKLI